MKEGKEWKKGVLTSKCSLTTNDFSILLLVPPTSLAQLRKMPDHYRTRELLLI